MMAGGWGRDGEGSFCRPSFFRWRKTLRAREIDLPLRRALDLCSHWIMTQPGVAESALLEPQPFFTTITRRKIMSQVDYIPKGYNTVTPYLVIKGAARAIEYYKNVFGATVVVLMPGTAGKVGHAELQIGDSRIMLADENPEMGSRSAESIGASPVSLYLYLPDCDQVVAKAVAEGAKIMKPVEDQFYGDRSGFIQDPFGHFWGIATHKEDVSPQELEERARKVMRAA
jgi:PhnB protein